MSVMISSSVPFLLKPEMIDSRIAITFDSVVRNPLINAGLDYNNQQKGIRGSLYFNVQGKTLEVVGDGFYPDVYTMPFNSLNFNLSKQFKNNTSLTFRIRNLLNDERESLFEGYGGTTEYFRFRNIGRTYSLGYSVKF